MWIGEATMESNLAGNIYPETRNSAVRPRSPELAVQSFFAADTSTHTRSRSIGVPPSIVSFAS